VGNTISSDDGTYTCTVTNSFGSHNRSIRVRIKSKVLVFFDLIRTASNFIFDFVLIIKGRLAPLWPFLGLLGEIALLAAFITAHWYFAKRNDAKKVNVTANSSEPQAK
jgi:hypothetical protein